MEQKDDVGAGKWCFLLSFSEAVVLVPVSFDILHTER